MGNDVVFALATADDLAEATTGLGKWLSGWGIRRVEWWWIGDDGAPELVAAAGSPGARRHTLPLGAAGELVLHGRRPDPKLWSALSSLTPILRRRATEERLTRRVMRLARRNEALEDFAALVAHELKTPLHAALVADDPSGLIDHALELVESVLEAARIEAPTFASATESLGQAVDDLHAELAITADVDTALPLPPESLRVILRNLLANAAAAGADHVDVRTERSSSSCRLVVDDDGVGLANADRYASGSGLGLSLSRRLAGRFGGLLRVAPGPSGGTRATLEFVEAAR